MEVNLGLRWRLGRGTLAEAGEELFRLLHGVRDLGSLSAAAKHIGVSYRHAWGLLGEWADRFGYELVELERGRGARLSPLGESLLRAERKAENSVGAALRSLETELTADLVSSVPHGDSGSTRLRVFASHSMMLEILREMLSADKLRLDLHFRGSIDSLRMLHQGRCDLAGFHIADQPIGQALSAHDQPWLRAREHSLIKVVAREQGLMVAHGNPLGIQGIKDLAKTKLRFINRQPESGTRLLFDLLLARSGIKPAAIFGYDVEEFTHIAVAALIAGGAADVGPGIQAAAKKFDLGFVPLTRETYYLAVRTAALSISSIQHLRKTLGSQEFAHAVESLGGYDVSGSGAVLRVDDAIAF